MPHYWVIAPYSSEDAAFFDRVWQFDLANNTISIGWSELGNVSTMDRQTLSNAVTKAFPNSPLATKSLFAVMLWSFYHVIAPGDVVLARRGRKSLAAVGTVTKSAYYAPGKNPHLSSSANSHPNFIDVSWQAMPRDKFFSSIVFPMHTLSEFSEVQYQSLLEGGGSQQPTVQAGEPIEDLSAFVLEKYLEDFIVSNFATIFRGELILFEDAEGSDGQQCTTDVGPMDILAVEPATNSLVVIELKKGRASDQVVGQVLRYMGWVKEKLCAKDQAVKGLEVCSEPDPRLSYALSMTNNVQIKDYSVSFKLRDAP
jgi:restriction system protein